MGWPFSKEINKIQNVASSAVTAATSPTNVGNINQSKVDLFQKPAETIGSFFTANYLDDRLGNIGSRGEAYIKEAGKAENVYDTLIDVMEMFDTSVDTLAVPDAVSPELDLVDPFSADIDLEFARGAKSARGSSTLSKEDLLSQFVSNNTVNIGASESGVNI